MQACLIEMLKVADGEGIFLACELAQVVFVNIRELQRFMIDHVLNAARRLDSSRENNRLVMLIVLDFICQLSSPRFSSIEGQNMKYSQEEI